MFGRTPRVNVRPDPAGESSSGIYTHDVPAFQVGDWRVHPSLNRLSKNGQDAHIEPKVMQVLECLAEKPGDVVSRDELVARVWPGVFVTDDVLHRAIRELRRVFGDETANPTYIETIRKRGYRLLAPVAAIQSSTHAPPASGRVWTMAAAAAAAVALGTVVYALVFRSSSTLPDSTRVRFVA